MAYRPVQTSAMKTELSGFGIRGYFSFWLVVGGFWSMAYDIGSTVHGLWFGCQGLFWTASTASK